MALTQINTGGIKDDAVTDAKLPANSVGNSEMKDDAVGIAELSATGTASSSTFLRGDNSWVTPTDTNTQVGGATGVDFNDDVYIRLGTSNDLKIWHNAGGDSYIRNESGNLLIEANGAGDDAIKIVPDGAVELFNDGSKKFETYSSGTLTTGNCKATGDFRIENDSGKIELGASGDLQLYHDGTHSHILNTTGDLRIKDTTAMILQTNSLRLRNADNDETYIAADDDGGVELYYDNVKHFETNSGGCKVNDSKYFACGNGNDLQIYHDGSNTKIDNATGELQIFADTFRVISKSTDENIIKGLNNGGVELYHNNDKQFEVNAAGTQVYDHDSTVQTEYITSGSTTCGFIYGENDDNLGFLDKSGNWRIRATDAGYQFYGTNHSDRDLKENITTISGSSLDKLNKLTAKSYNWKATESGKIDTSQTYVGFIAQEVQPHFPELVSGTDGKKDMGLDYSGLYAHAIKAIQELSTEVETLKTEVAALKAE